MKQIALVDLAYGEREHVTPLNFTELQVCIAFTIESFNYFFKNLYKCPLNCIRSTWYFR